MDGDNDDYGYGGDVDGGNMIYFFVSSVKNYSY